MASSLFDIDPPEDLSGYVQIQDIISDLNSSNYESSAKDIIELSLCSTTEGLEFLIKEILRISVIRPKISKPLAQFSKKISSNIAKFKQILLTRHTTTKNFNFFRHCFDQGIFNINDVKELITKYNPYARDERFLLFATFAKEIGQADPQLSFEFLMLIGAQNSCPGLHYVLPHLETYIRDKRLEKINEYGCEESSINYILKYDELERFVEFTVQPHFSCDDTITPNKFEPCQIVEGTYFTDYAAFFGSVQIFKMLYGQKAKNSNASRYAIAGGNLEITRILSDLIQKYDTSFLTAIEFFQNHIFDWLLSLMPLSDTMKQQCLFQAVKCNNIRAILFFAEFGADFSALDSENNTLLHHAVSYGCVPVIKYILAKGVNPTVQNTGGLRAKQFTRDLTILSILEEAEKNF